MNGAAAASSRRVNAGVSGAAQPLTFREGLERFSQSTATRSAATILPAAPEAEDDDSDG